MIFDCLLRYLKKLNHCKFDTSTGCLCNFLARYVPKQHELAEFIFLTLLMKVFQCRLACLLNDY